MTRKEFEDITGITDFTDEYYHNVIEEGYYRCSMDKEAYCKAVVFLVGNPLLEEWVGRMKNSNDLNEIYRREQKEDTELMLAIAEQIRYTAEGQAKVLEDRAADRIGRKKTILYKASKNLGLTADDLNYIKNNLQ